MQFGFQFGLYRVVAPLSFHVVSALHHCFLEKIPIKDRASEVDINKDPLPTVKTLEITWLSEDDVVTFKSNPPEENFRITKRNFLKKIATLFDPVGFLAPFTIRAKVMMQEMWVAGLE